MVGHDEFKAANTRAAQRRKSTPRAVSAEFDSDRGKLVIELSTGSTISFRPGGMPGLEYAEEADLKQIAITPSGFGLHFPRIDADLDIPALLEGFLGSRAPARLAAKDAKVKVARHPRKRSQD